MPMIIPAVDILGGRCVRLHQGDYAKRTVYYNRPADAAKVWADQGAELIHLVDLDGAHDGLPKNLDAIAEITHEIDVPVEIGGGIRTTETIQRYFSLGISRLVVGTRALQDPEWLADVAGRFPGRIVVDIGARNGRVAVEGWVETSDVDAFDFAKQVDALPLCAIVFTDVATDGAMSGPNLPALQRMTETVETPVVASGGISTLDDVARVATLHVEGMIIGRALFDGAFTLQEAIAKTSRGEG